MANAPLPGFHYIDNRRRVVDERTGEILPKRQYLELRRERLGLTKGRVSLEKYAASRKGLEKRPGKPRPELERLRKRWRQTHPTQKSTDPRRAVKELRDQLKRMTKRSRRDNSPTGRKARLLVELGLRLPEWQFPVGESPPGILDEEEDEGAWYVHVGNFPHGPAIRKLVLDAIERDTGRRPTGNSAVVVHDVPLRTAESYASRYRRMGCDAEILPT